MAKGRGRQSHPEGGKIAIPPEERLRLKTLREGKGWSQAELARRARTTQGTISNLENGTTQPYLSVYQRVVAALSGQEVSAQAEEALRRISSGLARLDEDNRSAVETMINSLLRAQAKTQE